MRRSSALVGLALVSLSVGALGQGRVRSRYEMVIPEIPFDYDYGLFGGVNDRGQIVGEVITQSPFSARAVLSGPDGGPLAILSGGRTPTETSYANAVNGNGDAAGGNGRGVIWWVEKGYECVVPADAAGFRDLNGRGEGVGLCTGAEVFAFYWSRQTGTMKISVPPATWFTPLQISEDGTVVGTVTRFGLDLPATWTRTHGLRELPLLPGASEGRAGSVNSLGEILGVCLIKGRQSACVWSDGNVLPVLTPDGAYVYGIDDRGWIIGRDASEETIVWTDRNKPPIRAVELVTPASCLSDRIEYTQDVSDNGHVLALCRVDGGRLLPCLLVPLD